MKGQDLPNRPPRRRRARRRLTRAATTLLLGAAMLVPVGVSAVAASAAQDTAGDRRPVSGADAVTAWNANAGKAAIAACIAPVDNPLHESRMYAMTHIAVHDALNAIDRRYEPYALTRRDRTGARPEAAVAAAARGALVAALAQLTGPFAGACSAAGIASVERDYAAAVAALPAGRRTTNGLALGAAAADAIVARRADDGSDTLLVDDGYAEGSAPGEWRFTPDRLFAFAPGWSEVSTFALRDSSQYRPGPPYRLSSGHYARDLAEVKALGGDGVTTPSTRTSDQTQIAYFWLESSPLLWNRVARTVSTSEHLDMWENARLFGLLNMALADGYVASFDTKYRYDFWRPVTAIREAGADGNRSTRPDPTWTPLVTTPPIPDYDSAHAVEGGAAAAVLRGFFGTDRVSFSTCSYLLPENGCDDPSPVLRRFRSFSQAADENADSRVYIGFHFRDAVETGTGHGRSIGDATVRSVLEPVRRHHR